MHEELDDDSPFVINARCLTSLVIIVLVCAIASSAGVGGGAIFIPLFNALVGFNLKSSTALSQACITCGAAATLLANLMHHHPSDPRVALVDFTLAAVVTPILLMGVGIGVLLNVMLPAWLLTGLLLLLLTLLVVQSVTKGRALWLQESVLRNRNLPQHQLRHQPGSEQLGVGRLTAAKQRRFFEGRVAAVASGEGEVESLQEPLLAGGDVDGCVPSPRRYLTPAPTSTWHLLGEAEADGDEEEEDVGGPGASGNNNVRQLEAAVVVAADIVMENKSTLPVDSQYLDDKCCSVQRLADGADKIAGAASVFTMTAETEHPPASTVSADAATLLEAPLHQRQHQLTHRSGSPTRGGPTAVHKSPFLPRKSPPASARPHAAVTAPGSESSVAAKDTAVAASATATSARILHDVVVQSSGAVTACAVQGAPPQRALERAGSDGGGDGAGVLSPKETAAAFAETLAAALAAVAASSDDGMTWTSSSWVAAATSLFMLTSQSWRGLNELGIVVREEDEELGDDTDDDDDKEAGVHTAYDDCTAVVGRSHSHGEGVVGPRSSCRKPVAGGSDGDVRGGGQSSLQSVVVGTAHLDHRGGRSTCGGNGGEGEGGGTAEPPGLSRVRGLPGPQLSPSSRRSLLSAATCSLSHTDDCRIHTTRRKSMGGHAPAASIVPAAAPALMAPASQEGSPGALDSLVRASSVKGDGDCCDIEGRMQPPTPPPAPSSQYDTPGLREGYRPAALVSVLTHGSHLTHGPPSGGRGGLFPALGSIAAAAAAAQRLFDDSAHGRNLHTDSMTGCTDVTNGRQQERDNVYSCDNDVALLQPLLPERKEQEVACRPENARVNDAARVAPSFARTSKGVRSRTRVRHGGEGLMASLALALQRIPPLELLALLATWSLFLSVQMLRKRVLLCSPAWWGLVAVQVVSMVVLSIAAVMMTKKAAFQTTTTTAVSAAVVATSSSEGRAVRDGEADVALRTPVLLLVMSCTAGLAGGLLGLGGGMIMGPLLFHLGVQPQVTAATTGAMVLISSSAALTQFAMMGRLNLSYATVFGASSAAASLVGSQLLSRAVRRSGRPSLVVLSLAGVMGVGAVCVAVFGVQSVWEEMHGAGGGAGDEISGGLAALCS